jgi:hypothetical protein
LFRKVGKDLFSWLILLSDNSDRIGPAGKHAGSKAHDQYTGHRHYRFLLAAA